MLQVGLLLQRMFSNSSTTRACPNIVSLFLAQSALVCSSRSYVPSFIRDNLRACPAVMAILTTYFTPMVICNSPIVMAYLQLSACSSVVAFSPAHTTRELRNNRTILEFWTVVPPMPFTSTGLAVELHSCIRRVKAKEPELQPCLPAIKSWMQGLKNYPSWPSSFSDGLLDH